MVLYNLLYRGKLQTPSFIRTYYRAIPKTSEFTTLFLKNKCGLTGKTLIRASNLVRLASSHENGPDSVLRLFQTFGFSQTHITIIISRQPRILTYRSEKYLKPKLDFLLSITQSELEVVSMVTKRPLILRTSLNNYLIPVFNLLKSVTGSDQNAAAAIKCNPFVLSYCISKFLLRNIEFLQTLGVPQPQILKFITNYGQCIGVEHGKFCKLVLKVKELGFDLSSSYFVTAVHALNFVPDSIWESRGEVYRSFGFSNDEIFNMFKKNPAVRLYSVKRIRKMLEFFVHKLRWSPSRLSTIPYVLQYSLEKRTIPRCSVLQALVSNKCNYKGLMLRSILAMTESRFLESFVTAYKDEVPEVMDAYRGKLRFNEYNFE